MGYAYSQTITISASLCGSANSTNFPLLFGGSAGPYTALKTVANGGNIQNTVVFNGQTVPADLIFTSDSAGLIPLPFEIASYNPATGDIEVWIQIPTLTFATSTVIYMFAGNPSVSTYQGGGVGATYDSTFEIVNHFANGSSLSVLDSTGNANNGAVTGGVTAVSGEIDGGAAFNGSTGYVAIPASASLNNWVYQTISLWMKAAANSQATYGRLIEKGANNEWSIVFNSGTTNYLSVQDIGTTNIGPTSTEAVCDGTWHKIDVLLDNTVGGISIYVDGVFSTGIGSGSIATTLTSAIHIGTYGQTPGSYLYNGSMDELHIANVLRSASWITAAYNNQSSPSTFYTLTSNPLTGATHSVSLSWVASTDPVDGYNVYRGTAPGAEGTTPLNGSTLIVGTTFVDTAPVIGNDYYTIQSSLGGVLSQPSAEVEATIVSDRLVRHRRRVLK